MKRVFLIIVLLAGILTGASAQVDSGWTVVATEKTGDKPVVVTIDQVISKLAVACIEGEVLLDRVEVDAGEQTMDMAVKGKLRKNESQQISVGNQVQGRRITVHAAGAGRYEIRVKK